MGFTTVIIITSGVIIFITVITIIFEAISSSKMTISGQIEVKNYSDKPILRFILSIVFFVDIWADFCGKLARFREFLTHIGIFEHFWDIFDPFPIQKAQFFCRKSDLNVHRMTSEVVLWITKPSESRHFSLLFKTNSHFHKSSQKSEFYSNGESLSLIH